MKTPEFLVWALGYSCPVRGFQDGSDPERTERQLRAARAVGDARREGREFEGFCLDPPNGFRIADALAIYGGLDAVEKACSICPANIRNHDGPGALAGCFGQVIVYRLDSFFEAVDVAVEAMAGVDPLFPVTTPRWYGLWIDSPVRGTRAERTALILESVHEELREAIPGLNGLISAIRRASNDGLAIHVLAYPESSSEVRGWWVVASHCPRCKITWSTEARRVCPSCGYEGRGTPFRKRRARGSRPYYPLDRLLGPQQAAEFLVRYEESRKRRKSTPAGQSPLRAAPQDSPPAD
jgi:hypothetical protein